MNGNTDHKDHALSSVEKVAILDAGAQYGKVFLSSVYFSLGKNRPHRQMPCSMLYMDSRNVAELLLSHTYTTVHSRNSICMKFECGNSGVYTLTFQYGCRYESVSTLYHM